MNNNINKNKNRAKRRYQRIIMKMKIKKNRIRKMNMKWILTERSKRGRKY